MPRKSKPLPENLLELTEDAELPALPDSSIAAIAALLDASPEEFQAGMAKIFRRLELEGLRTIRAPRNIRELATMSEMRRKAEGLDKDKGGSAPVGLVGVLRGVSRRVVDAVEVPDVPGFE